MTAQIISFTERRDVIRLRRDAQYQFGLIWPTIFFGCAMFWISAGVLAVHLAHGTLPAHG